MSEQFKTPESEGGELPILVEKLREIHFDINHPRNQEFIEDLVRMRPLHPEWIRSAAWHRLIGSTPKPGMEMTPDSFGSPIGIFIKELADKYLS